MAAPTARSARARSLLSLGLPIVGGMISQNVLNLVDTAMVGRVGADALAAVGIASITAFLAGAFVMGLSSGVQAMAARRLGEGRIDATAVPLNAGLILALGFALPLSGVLLLFVDAAFPYLHADPAVVSEGIPYLQARFAAIPAVGMNFAFRGYFNGVNRSGLYMRTLLVMHGANVLLNYALIFGNLGFPELGATGAGIATCVATYLGTAMYIALGSRHARAAGFLRRRPDRLAVTTLIRLSVPAGLQTTLVAGAYTALFTIIGRIGTIELAAANILVNLMLVTRLPAMAFGMASASLVGQALGRGDPNEAMRWGWAGVWVAAVVMTPVGIPMVVAPDLLLSWFLDDVAIVAVARFPLQIMGVTIALEAVGVVLLHSTLGAGAARTAMVVSILLQWGLLLPGAYLVGPVLGFGLIGVWTAQVLQRAIQTAVFVAIWRGGRWARARV